VTDHYFDICVHGIPWCHCGCDDPGFDDEDDVVDQYDEELDDDDFDDARVVFGPSGTEALGPC
jgi:hypothetical protein